MSLFKRTFKKSARQGSVSDPPGHSLFLYVSEMGWEMQIIDDFGKTEGERRREDCSLLKNKIPDRLETIIGRAAKSLSKSDRKQIGKIHILLSDPATLYVDDLGGELKSAGPDAIRQMAKQQLNCPSAAYGVSEFSSASGKKSFYGITDHSLLRAMMHQLGDLAPKVVDIIPAASLLAPGSNRENTPQCALLIDAYNTKLVLVDLANDCVLVRVLPIGVMSLPAALAEHTRVNLKKAQLGLEKRDIIATLKIGVEAEHSEQNISKGPFHEAIGPLLLDLKKEIESTLTYATDQRFSELPSKIQAYGDFAKVDGLFNWLTSNLSLPMEIAQKDLFALFTDQDTPPAMNLLFGTEGELVSVGKTKYSYSKDGFVEDAPVEKTKVQGVPKGSGVNKRGKNAGKGGARQSRRGTQQDQATFFGLKLPNKKDGGQAGSGQETSESLYYFVIGLVFFAILYGAYVTYYEDALLRHRIARIGYEQALAANNAARSQLTERPVNKGATLQEVDKVLWSEKMLAIAKHMDDKMWISDVYLVDETVVFNSQSVSARKLTIEGAVLPSTQGHILEIARYISRLTEDKWFMRDFSHITFEGAALDTQETAHVVKFTLGAWYDETKVKTIEEDGEKNTGPTGKMMNKVNKRTNTLEQIRDGSGSSVPHPMGRARTRPAPHPSG